MDIRELINFISYKKYDFQFPGNEITKEQEKIIRDNFPDLKSVYENLSEDAIGILEEIVDQDIEELTEPEIPGFNECDFEELRLKFNPKDWDMIQYCRFNDAVTDLGFGLAEFLGEYEGGSDELLFVLEVLGNYLNMYPKALKMYLFDSFSKKIKEYKDEDFISYRWEVK